MNSILKVKVQENLNRVFLSEDTTGGEFKVSKPDCHPVVLTGFGGEVEIIILTLLVEDGMSELLVFSTMVGRDYQIFRAHDRFGPGSVSDFEEVVNTFLAEIVKNYELQPTVTSDDIYTKMSVEAMKNGRIFTSKVKSSLSHEALSRWEGKVKEGRARFDEDSERYVDNASEKAFKEGTTNRSPNNPFQGEKTINIPSGRGLKLSWKRCPKCQEMVKGEAKKCFYCGAPFPNP